MNNKPIKFKVTFCVSQDGKLRNKERFYEATDKEAAIEMARKEFGRINFAKCDKA